MAHRAAGQNGLDFLRALAAGELPAPPFARTVGTRLAEVESGRVVFEFRRGSSTTTRSAACTAA